MSSKKSSPKKVFRKIIMSSSVGHLNSVQTKFKQLRELRSKLEGIKRLYAEHDRLMGELLPLFITQSPDQFVIKREIQIGSEKYRFIPRFYDEKKDMVLAKCWKSTAFESGTIS
jgi:hypothetical protein